MSDILIKGLEIQADNTVLIRVFPASENGEFYVQQLDVDGDICDCGTERVLNGRSLRTGDSRSCGCLRADLNRERIKRETAARKAALV